MSTTKLRIWLFFISLSDQAAGQIIKTDSQYIYTIVTYNDPIQRPLLIKNQITGIADTTLSFVYGKVVKSDSNPLSLAVITLKTISEPQSKFVSRTDRYGEYQLYVKPGYYNLSIESTTPFYLNNLNLGSRERREINVLLKKRSSYMTTNYKTKKPLSDMELKKYENHNDSIYNSIKISH